MIYDVLNKGSILGWEWLSPIRFENVVALTRLVVCFLISVPIDWVHEHPVWPRFRFDMRKVLFEADSKRLIEAVLFVSIFEQDLTVSGKTLNLK